MRLFIWAWKSFWNSLGRTPPHYHGRKVHAASSRVHLARFETEEARIYLSTTTTTIAPAFPLPAPTSDVPAAIATLTGQQRWDAEMAKVGRALVVNTPAGEFQTALGSTDVADLKATAAAQFVGPLVPDGWLDGYTQPLFASDEMPTAIEFDGPAGSDNTLDLDLSMLPHNADGSSQIKYVIYNGGSGGANTLAVKGGSFGDETYIATGKDSGIIQYDDMTVIFRQLTPVIDVTRARRYTFVDPGAGTVRVEDGDSQTAYSGDGWDLPEVGDAYGGYSQDYGYEPYAHLPDGWSPYGGDYSPYSEGDFSGSVDTLLIRDPSQSPSFEQATVGNKDHIRIIETASGGSIQLQYTRPATAIQRDGSVTSASLTAVTMGYGGPYDPQTIDASALGPSSGTVALISSGSDDVLIGGTGDNTFVFSRYYELAWDESSGSRTIVANPSATNNKLDFSDLDQGVTIDLGRTDAQAISPSLPWQLTLTSLYNDGDNGITSVVGAAGANTFIGGGRAAAIYGTTTAPYYVNSITYTIIPGDAPLTFYGQSGVSFGNMVTLAAGGTGSVTLVGGTDNVFAFDPSGGPLADTTIIANPVSTNVLRFAAFAADQPVSIDLSRTDKQTVCDGLLNLTLESVNNDGNTGIQYVNGGAGDDFILGNNLANGLGGGQGNDYIDGGAGNDYLDGGTGDDQLLGEDGVDTLLGEDGNDWLDGGAGSDSLIGNDGNDTLIGGAGNDTLTGGAGDDTYLFDPAAASDANLGTDSIAEDANLGSDTIDLSAFTSSQNVQLNLGTVSTTTAQVVTPNVLSLKLLNNNTGIENLIAGDGTNTITGNSRDNIISAGNGTNTINGVSGNNTITLGNGNNNTINSGNGNNLIGVGSGTGNVITVGNGTNSISAGSGGLGSGSISVGSGNNSIRTEGDPNGGNPNGYPITPGNPPGNNLINGVAQFAAPEFSPTAIAAWNSAEDEGDSFVDDLGDIFVNIGFCEFPRSDTLVFTVAADVPAGQHVSMELVEGPGTWVDNGDGTLTITWEGITDANAGLQEFKVRATNSDFPSLATEQKYYVDVMDQFGGAPETDPPGSGDPLLKSYAPIAHDNFEPVPAEGAIDAPSAQHANGPPAFTVAFQGTPPTYTLVTPPQHDVPGTFHLNANGSYHYESQEGFAGIDKFTYKVTDSQNRMSTAVFYLPKANIAPQRVTNKNQGTGFLSDANKISVGAFLPVNEDDDDDSGGADMFKQRLPQGEEDLLPIRVKAMPEGTFTLNYNTNDYRVWDAKKAAVVVPNDTKNPIDATKDQTFYVEAVKTIPLAGPDSITVNWTATKTRDQRGALLTAADHFKVTPFRFEGPADVPGKSTYTYATQWSGGAYPAGAVWVPSTGADLKGTGYLNAPTNTEPYGQYQWHDNPARGHISFKVDNDYTWDMRVNVVHVEVRGLPGGGNVFDVAQTTARDLAGGYVIQPGNHPGDSVSGRTPTAAAAPLIDDGIHWTAIVSLTGPQGKNAPRGVDHIKTGFIQTATNVTLKGTYGAAGTLTSDLGSRMSMNDAGTGAPWYRTDTYSTFTGQNFSDPSPRGEFDGVLVGNTFIREIKAGDGPQAGVPWTKQQGALAAGTDPLTKIDFDFKFTLEVMSVTTDSILETLPYVHMPVPYPRMAVAAWEFNGSGTYVWATGPTGTYTWTATGPGYVLTSDIWSTKDKGNLYNVPTTPNFTDQLKNNQTFSP